MQFRRGILKVAATAAVLVVVMLGAASSAFAATGDAALDRDHAGRNGDVTITAGGFKPSTPVELYQTRAIGDNDLQFGSTKTADASGNISATFRSSLTAGPYRIRLVGLDPSGAPRKTSAILTVLSNCENQTCASLPRTGGVPLMWWGLGALGVGVVAVRLGKRVPVGKYSLLAVVVIGAVVAGTTALPKAYAAATATINGHVQDKDTDAALSDICVHAVAGTNFASARTNAQGDYTLSNLEPGTYTLSYLDCRSLDTYFGAANTGTAVADGATVTAAPMELTQGANVQGIVTDATSGAGVDLVCIRLAAAAAPNDFSTCQFGTTQSGVFFPDPIVPGTYGFAFQDLAGDHAIRYLGNANDSATDTTLTVAKGGLSSPINMALPAGATVTGTVVDDGTSQPPADELCVVDISHDVATLASSFVGDDGKFEIFQVAPGDHKFRFGKCEFSGTEDTQYVTQYYSQKATIAAADPVTLTAAQQKGGVDARVSKTGVPTSTTPPGNATTTTTTLASTTTTSAAGGGATTTSTTTVTRRTSTGTASSSASTAPVGGSVTVSGSGFQPGSTVQAALFSTPKIVGSATANAAGSVSISFVVPAGTDVGTHEIQLQGVNASGGSHVLSATLVVRAGTLSRTGSDASTLLLYALAMLVLGVSLFTLTYRRRVGSHFAG